MPSHTLSHCSSSCRLLVTSPLQHTAGPQMPHVHMYNPMHDRPGPKTLGRTQASLPTIWMQQAAIANFSVQIEDGAIHASANSWSPVLRSIVCLS